jgi:hypothetical protein
MYTGLLTSVERKTNEVVGLPLEEVRFHMPTVKTDFGYVCIEGNKLAHGGEGIIETIIEEEGRVGYRLIILTRKMEYHLRNVEVAT